MRSPRPAPLLRPSAMPLSEQDTLSPPPVSARSGGSQLPVPFDPITHPGFSPGSPHVAQLRQTLIDALERSVPDTPFEGSKDKYGITHERFQHLHKAWIDFLDEPGDDGFEDDTWAGYIKHMRSFKHYTLQIEDIDLHFVRERPDAAAEVSGRPIIPLLLLHGWPGHFMEFADVIKPLAHPGATAPLSVPAFDVIVPSLPGYVFSSYFYSHTSKISGKVRAGHSGVDGDLTVPDVARIMDLLMCRLGFAATGYVVQGGDIGSYVARMIAVDYPNRCRAVHLNFCPVPPPPMKPLWPIRMASYALVPSFISKPVSSLTTIIPSHWYAKSAPFGVLGSAVHHLASFVLGVPAPLSEREKRGVLRRTEFLGTGAFYARMHGTRPSTIGLVLHSSPLALLAWIGEKFYAWTDEDPSDAEVLASLTMYWLTETMPRSIYSYRNSLPIGSFPIRVPTGYTDNPREIVPTPKAWVAASCNLRWHRSHARGGHFFAMENPAQFVEDIQDCFAKLFQA